MIGHWLGPHTTHNNRLLVPGRPADVDPAQAQVFERMGYFQPAPAAPPGKPDRRLAPDPPGDPAPPPPTKPKKEKK
jgi:hypothetical protein